MNTWRAIAGGIGADRRVVYWNKNITPLLRLAVKGRTWTVYTRDDPRYAWTREATGTSPTLAAAKLDAESYALRLRAGALPT